MANWLNALKSGECGFTVYRDGSAVPDLAAVGATLTTTGGVVQLTTPTSESHTWEVVVSADFLIGTSKLRMRNASFAGLPGLTTAQARLWVDGALTESISLTTANPITPNPAAFTDFGNAVTLFLDET